MQEFLTNDTVNCNLMSLTGYRTLVLLQLLMESPVSNSEINEHFFNNKYIKEKFSNDTLRIYINSLRLIGCDITRASKATNNKYVLRSHPFDFEISKTTIKALSKLYKNIHDKIAIKDILALENLFDKIYSKIKNPETQLSFKNISLLKNINKTILKELILHCDSKHQIKFLYKSPHSGEKEIEIIADKIEFRTNKLYIWGYSLNHDEYAFFRVDRILNSPTVKLKNDEMTIQEIRVIVELYDSIKTNYHPDKNETLLEKTPDKIVVEIISKNKFNLLQKLLFWGKDCKVVSPDEIQNELIDKLTMMKGFYN